MTKNIQNEGKSSFIYNDSEFNECVKFDEQRRELLNSIGGNKKETVAFVKKWYKKSRNEYLNNIPKDAVVIVAPTVRLNDKVSATFAKVLKKDMKSIDILNVKRPFLITMKAETEKNWNNQQGINTPPIDYKIRSPKRLKNVLKNRPVFILTDRMYHGEKEFNLEKKLAQHGIPVKGHICLSGHSLKRATEQEVSKFTEWFSEKIRTNQFIREELSGKGIPEVLSKFKEDCKQYFGDYLNNKVNLASNFGASEPKAIYKSWQNITKGADYLRKNLSPIPLEGERSRGPTLQM